MAGPLTATYLAEMKRTRVATADHVAAYWDRLPDYRDERIPAFLRAVVPVVEAGQRRAVALTSAYLSRKTGQPPVGLDVASLVGAAVRGGVEPAEVYRRPFVTVWASIATLGVTAAAAKGLSRLTSTADMDVAMSGRDSLLAFGRDSGADIIGWTRVADARCCDFCQSIDGAHTGPAEPQPLHNRCGCSAEPVLRTRGETSRDPLLTIGAVIGAGLAAVKIHEHGELGPVIGAARDSFAGPNDLNDSDYIES